MKNDVVEALREAAEFRQRVLTQLEHDERVRLLEALFEDAFVSQRALLVKWSALTGQSAQVDTGYIAQHVASIVLGIPGQGFKGKGLDLMDRSEVKSAASLSGVDRPRWNHNLGKPADDVKCVSEGRPTLSEAYLSSPYLFYLLFDRVVDGVAAGQLVLRVRAWCLDVARDAAWRDLVQKWVAARKASTYNLQLHPPVGYDDDIVVNTLGNLDMGPCKVFEARMTGFGAGESFNLDWPKPLPDPVLPVTGRCVAQPYGGRKDRPSRLAGAADVAADLTELAALVPGLDLAALSKATALTAAVEAVLEEDGS